MFTNAPDKVTIELSIHPLMSESMSKPTFCVCAQTSSNIKIVMCALNVNYRQKSRLIYIFF